MKKTINIRTYNAKISTLQGLFEVLTLKTGIKSKEFLWILRIVQKSWSSLYLFWIVITKAWKLNKEKKRIKTYKYRVVHNILNTLDYLNIQEFFVLFLISMLIITISEKIPNCLPPTLFHILITSTVATTSCYTDFLL